MSEAPDHLQIAPMTASATSGDAMIQNPSAAAPWMKGIDLRDAIAAPPAGTLVFRLADDTEEPFYGSSFFLSRESRGHPAGIKCIAPGNPNPDARRAVKEERVVWSWIPSVSR